MNGQPQPVNLGTRLAGSQETAAALPANLGQVGCERAKCTFAGYLSDFEVRVNCNFGQSEPQIGALPGLKNQTNSLQRYRSVPLQAICPKAQRR